MSDLDWKLPPPLAQALTQLRNRRDAQARVDAIADNFAYVWLCSIDKNNSGDALGGWIRLPLAFPYANPHGLITKEALTSSGGKSITDGYNPGHSICDPVRHLGGAHYYSWTWGDGPRLSVPEDILGVVQWYERRIRKG